MSRRPWKYAKYGGRKTGVLEIKQRFLIVCEGLKTEPNYFKGFRVPKNVVVDIHPGAGSHASVVRKAIKERDKSPGEYDQIWCVFDRDKNRNNATNTHNFNEGLRLAASEGIQVAYSNDAFELWYLLHFDYYDTAISRADYVTKLHIKLGHAYLKNDPDIYKKLEGKMHVAHTNATRLLSQYNPPDPEKDDPSTTVHMLVAELKKYM